MTVWDELAAGNNCSFDAPRAAHAADWDAVATLRAGTLYLRHNQTYRGHCVLVFDPRHATRLDQLSPSEWGAFSEDLHAAARAITAVCAPDHVNVASLGNLMPHLHWHIVPRYKSDPQWGRPVWMADLAETDTRLPAAERAALLAALQGELGPQRRD